MTNGLVTVGMTAYNAEETISETIDSVLGQTYRDFELIISDNASTDSTSEICQNYARRDKRVRYLRRDSNIGSFRNFNSLLDLSARKYFIWASDHDLWAPQLLQECLQILEQRPEVVLTYPRSRFIDVAGKPGLEIEDHYALDIENTLHRYRRLIWRLTWCNMFYGLHRSDVIRATGGLKTLWAADHLLLADVALRGPIVQIPRIHYFRRQNRLDETDREQVLRMLDYMNPDQEAPVPPDNRSLFRPLRNAHLRLVAQSDLKLSEKATAAADTMLCFGTRFEVRARGLSPVVSKFPAPVKQWLLQKMKGVN